MSLFDKHQALLNQAVNAAKTREYWSAFPENPSPKIYGETAQADGQAAAEAYFGKNFPLTQSGTRGFVATEKSPYGVALNVAYPDVAPKDLIANAVAAEAGWQAIGAQGRVGVLLEALTRIHQRTHEITHAVMLTSGQGPMMAFQAGGPHAQDRALEAITYAWLAQADVPAVAHWEKPQGKNPPLVMQKHFEVVGRGVGLVIGCATFPTWNTYPGLFASLATGNPVIVKPHPNAVLPMAITVAILRDVLQEQGLDPNVVQLGLSPNNADTQALATDPAVALIDFTGGTAFGQWLGEHAKQARLYAEMAGVNTVILESTDDYAATMKNLAFTLALYSGQMCTTTQNILIPEGGIATNEGHKSFDQVGQDLGAALSGLLGDVRVATAVLGAIASPATSERIAASAQVGRMVHASQTIAHPQFPDAVLQTPQLIALTEADSAIYNQECFGPVAYLVAVKDGAAALAVAQKTLREHGALTLGVYSQNAAYIDQAVKVSLRGKVALSINLTQGIYVNQSAAFSDFHATGGNPAANASYTNLGFVADRFVIVQRRAHV